MGRLLVIGFGDLARRLLPLLVRLRLREVVVAARSTERAAHQAEILTLCGGPRFSCLGCDATDESAVASLITRVEPDLVLQTATFVSPWRVARAASVADAELARVLTAFGVQLELQLYIPFVVQRAARSVGYSGPVINASYPDAVNHALALHGLAPTLGIGNVQMSQLCVLARLAAGRHRGLGGADTLVRLIAHHYHTRGIVTGVRPRIGDDEAPRVFLGEEAEPAHELAYGEPASEWSRETNSLTALSALPVIDALIPGGAPLRASVPGPLGLPGGYPCVVTRESIELDLPEGIAFSEAAALNRRVARYDGLDYGEDGETVSVEPELRRVLTRLVPDASGPPVGAGWTPGRAIRFARALGFHPDRESAASRSGRGHPRLRR